MTISPLRAMRGSPAGVLASVYATVAIERRALRGRCYICHTRRVLYRVSVSIGLGDPCPTEARCAPCWGIREQEEKE